MRGGSPPTPSSMLESGTLWDVDRLPRMHMIAERMREKARLHLIHAMALL